MPKLLESDLFSCVTAGCMMVLRSGMSGGFYAFLPIWLHRQCGFGDAQIGALMAAETLSAMLLVPLISGAIDAYKAHNWAIASFFAAGGAAQLLLLPARHAALIAALLIATSSVHRAAGSTLDAQVLFALGDAALFPRFGMLGALGFG